MHQTYQTIRLQQNDQYQQQSIQQKVNLGKVYDQFFFHNTKDCAPEDRSPDCSDTADDRD